MARVSIEHWWHLRAPLICYVGVPTSGHMSRRCWVELKTDYDFAHVPYGVPGVYVLYLGAEVVYVGQSGNIRARMQMHRGRFQFDRAKVSLNEHKTERLYLERVLLVRLRPRRNGVVPTSVQHWFLRPRLA